MAFITRSFSFISLSPPSSSSSPSPYSPPTSSNSRSKQPKYPRKDRFKPKSKRNYPNKQEQEQNLLTEVFKGRKDEECPCPSCMYPDVDSGGSESSSSSSSSSSSFDNHDIESEESLNIVGVEDGGKLLEQRKREAGGELKMKWGLAWLRGRGTRGRGYGYGYGYKYGEINTYAGVS
ncbi:hypothetical protein BPAE_0321g00030 [Botrytis paeoniae]|uniref:Uncharacterized protein n=1 Tax=Botrytis paeoniae TaxID=278948 RepID=A0A4Z1FBH8_9HELO|nr:hypothetical protein BPAE_0321g00030 [Botrytis paeoniae]